MSKLTYIIAAFLCIAISAAAESLSVEDQTRIITAYGIATGQLQSQAAGVVPDTLPPNKCGTSAILNFVDNRNRLDPALMASLGVRTVARPVLPMKYYSPSRRFLIHYDTIGMDAAYQSNVRTLVDSVPDYVVMTARIADTVYMHEIDTLGYPPPPSDGFYPSGVDSAYDIYIINLGSQFYGLTYADSVLYPDTLRATSFLELDNDFQTITKYANRPLDAVRVTLAHEYFHAVQYGIDRTEREGNPASPRQYWMEMSATWMEDEVYDSINDYYAYLPYFFNFPTISIQAFGGAYDLHPYGAVVFPKYLSERYGKNIIRNIWLECAARGPGPNFLDACDAEVRAADTVGHDWNFASAMNEFAIWNMFTGPYASVAPTTTDTVYHVSRLYGYKDRANYPVIPQDQMLTITRYPHYELIDKGGFRPDYNGVGYVNIQQMQTRSACYIIDTAGAGIAVPCDSVLEALVYFQSDLTLGTVNLWALSLVYQLAEPADSFEINSFVVPVPVNTVPGYFQIDARSPSRYKSITMVFSPTTTETSFRFYSNYTAPKIGLAFSDSGIISTRPSAVLTPYPNPAVVADMGGRDLTFRFQVAADSTNSNITSDPLLSLDIFSVAGERVRTIDATFGGEDRLGVHSGGLYETTWNMQNDAAKKVASGVYLVIARLWKTPDKLSLLAESTVKVALVR